MKALIAFVTTENDDPNMETEFIAGYELHGGTWSGTLDTRENVTNADLDADYMQGLIDDGYSVLIRNGGLADLQQTDYAVITDALEQGLLCVTGAGDNKYLKNIPFKQNFLPYVPCGSGKRGSGNATAYPCMFYDQGTTEPTDSVEYIFPCGTVYDIIEIQRVNATVMSFKLDGVDDVRDVGIFGGGIPIYINALSGSDISPLPTGFLYTGGINSGGDGFFCTVPATTGTSSIYQSVTGNLTYGNDTSDISIVKVSSAQPLIVAGNPVTFTDVTGFDRDINGVNEIYEAINYDGYGDKFKISPTLGGGSYAGGGQATFASQSYSTPFIAGQLCWLKDRMGSGWFDILGRAIKTASRFESEGYTYLNGFGYLNVDDAVFETDISLDAPVLETISNSGYYGQFKWDPVPYAESYEVYFKGELFTTLMAHITQVTMTLPSVYREGKGIRRMVKVRAVRGTEYSEFSNEIEMVWYGNLGILATEAEE